MTDIINLDALNNTLNNMQKNKGLSAYGNSNNENNSTHKPSHQMPNSVSNMLESSVFPFSLGWILVYIFVMVIFLH